MNYGWADLVNKTKVISVSGGIWSPNRNTSKQESLAGIGREHTATGDFDRILYDAAALLPSTTAATLVIGQHKLDATLRSAVTFGAETQSGATTFACYIPFSDGKVYWDWGGISEGTTRLSIGSLSVTDDIWVFTVGARGMEIWQNGILRASNAATPTRTQWAAGTETLAWSKNNAGSTSDLTQYKFTFLYTYQFTVEQIAKISREPFCWVHDQYTLGEQTALLSPLTIYQAGLPLESRGIVAMSEDLPLEWSGFGYAPIPVEWTLGVASSSSLPVEWNQSLARGETLPWESTGTGELSLRWNVIQPLAATLLLMWDVLVFNAVFTMQLQWNVSAALAGLTLRWNDLPDVFTPFGVDPITGEAIPQTPAAPGGTFTDDIHRPVAVTTRSS